ncbi:MAG: hypothetical protein DHS20C15_31920 [Planctomycetota bacterium]|nr:MAG: hypothetical protein DHS20C15_31920 [Planctomycetota bacterium]
MSDADSRTAAALTWFTELCELAPAEQERALDERCDDALLRAEVEALLAADAQPSLAGPSAAQLATALSGELPERFGPFRVLDLIGRGGMGTVYRAQQERPARTVALKVLASGHLNDSARQRFELEVELLGRLEHEGIARIHAAGNEVTSSGTHPWFAMELVHGSPLLEHARALDRRARLQLFLRVCDAVEHAHRHGVIHRDLKSANVLVTQAGQPKVLDFGVARGADGERTRSSALTLDGQVVGTLSTMSPEQARGEVDAIDTRTDVYALGVLLHQLLTDRPPLELDGLPLADALRRITDDTPPALARHDATLAGDLDVITSKALEKQPARRYGSVGALADDLRRHLEHRTILASPPDTLDRVLRFARRHRLAVGGASVLLVALLSATLVSLSYWRDAERERSVAEGERGVAQTERAAAVRARDVAEQERSVAEQQRDRVAQLYAFLRGTFGAVDPNLAAGREISVREILDAAAAKLRADPPEDLALRADMHGLLGETYGDLSLMSQAREHLSTALALIENASTLDTNPPTSATIDPALHARALADLAVIAINEYDFARAEQLALRLRTLGEHEPSVTHDQHAVALHTLAMIQTRTLSERLEFVDAAIALVDTDTHAASHLRMLVARAELLAESGQAAAAMQAAEHVVELAQHSGRRSSLIQARSTLALLRAQQADPRAFDDARALLEELDDVLGADHPQTHAHLLSILHAWMTVTGNVPDFAHERLARAADDLAHAKHDVSPNTWNLLAQLELRRGDWTALGHTCDLALAPHAELLEGLDAGQDAPHDTPLATVLALLLEMRMEVRYRAAAYPEALADGALVNRLKPIPSSRFSQFMALTLLSTEGLTAAVDSARSDVTRMLAADQRADAAQLEFAIAQISERYAEDEDDAREVLAAYARGLALAGDAEVASTPNLDVALRTLGAEHASNGDPAAALACYLRITTSLQGAGPGAEASAHSELAGVQFGLARERSDLALAEGAFASFARAVALRREVRPRDTEGLAADLGNFAIALGQFDRRDACLERFDEAFALLDDPASPLHTALAGARAQLLTLFEASTPSGAAPPSDTTHTSSDGSR